MDKKTEQILLEAEALAKAAEGTKPIEDSATLGDAIQQALRLSRCIDLLTKARTAKNASYQKKVREHTGWFKPMLDRLALRKQSLRGEIDHHMNPTGNLGNQLPEEVAAYGTDGEGTASYSRQTEYDYDMLKLAKAHPELLSVDSAAVTKMIKAGKMPLGVTPKDAFQLRIA